MRISTFIVKLVPPTIGRGIVHARGGGRCGRGSAGTGIGDSGGYFLH